MPGPPSELRRRASPERQSVVLGERAISAAARCARECGVSQRTAAIYSGSVRAPPRRRRGGRLLVGPIQRAIYSGSVRAPPRRRRGGRLLVGPIQRKGGYVAPRTLPAPAGDRTWQGSGLVTARWLGDWRRP